MSFQELTNDIRNISSKEKIIILSSVLLLLLLPFVIFTATSSQKQETRTQAADISIDSLNTQVLENNRIGGLGGANRLLLEQRRTLMEKLAYDNPQEFLNKVMAPEVRNSFSEDQKGLIEESVNISGNLIVSHTDNFKESIAKTSYQIQTDNSIISIGFDESPSEEEIENVGKISLTGYKIGKRVVGQIQNMIILETKQATAAQIKRQYVVVFPINFTDDRSKPYSIQEIDNIFFGQTDSAKKYFKDLSSGDIILEGQVMNWRELSFKKDKICNDESKILAAYYAFEQLAYLGIPYDIIAFVHPHLDCGYGGWGTIGANPGIAFINDFNSGVIVHELGHNFGINHANLQRCIYGGCGDIEYGDESDAMGSRLAGMNNSHLRSLGLLANSTVSEFSGNKTYTIYKQGSAYLPQSIKFDMPNDAWDLYFEYRGKRVGIDANVPYDIGAGTVVYKWNGNPSSKTKLIDITPQDSNRDNLVIKDYQSIRLSRITVRQIRHTDNYVKVVITKN